MGSMEILKNSPFSLLKRKKGLLACGFISLETAERLGEAVAVVTGVSSIQELLERQ